MTDRLASRVYEASTEHADCSGLVSSGVLDNLPLAISPLLSQRSSPGSHVIITTLHSSRQLSQALQLRVGGSENQQG